MGKEENLALWRRHETSNPKDLKRVEYGRKFTSIDPQSQLKDATEEWGPFGTGFGVSKLSYDFIRDETGRIVSVLGYGTFWYKDEAGVHECETAADSTPFYSNSGKPDEDYAKKIKTSMISKELSRLGFNADVFLGMWDGCPYIGKGMGEDSRPQDAEKWAEQKQGRREKIASPSKPSGVLSPSTLGAQKDGGEAPIPESPEGIMARARKIDNYPHLKNFWEKHRPEAMRGGWAKEFDAVVMERKKALPQSVPKAVLDNEPPLPEEEH